MRIKKFLCAALAIAGLMTSADVSAQEEVIQWKGHDYNELVSSSGTEVFLYNVGTGRFLVHGGDWGVQARLFSNDNGKLLTIKYGSQNNIIFDTGMTTSRTVKTGTYAGTYSCNNLGCNIPKITSADNWGQDDATFTVLMDAQERIIDGSAAGSYRNWKFKKVEGTASDVYTYYMYETISGTDYYMGAVYGMNSGDQDGDPNGTLAMLSSSYDKATWTTAVPETDTKYTCGLKSIEQTYIEGSSLERSMNDNVRIFGGVDVELNKLYQWRLVTKAELLALVAENEQDTGSGLGVNLTYLIDDRGFERNDFSFFDGTYNWKAGTFTDDIYTTDGEGRHRYTWGFTNGSTANSTIRSNIAFTSSYYNRAWNANGGTDGIRYSETPVNIDNQNYKYPVRLKASFDSKTDAKYGFMEFEGVGTSYTYIPVPTNGAGVYKISCYGFYQGSHEGYLFATTKDPTTLSIADMKEEAISALQQRSGLSKNSEANVRTAGGVFAPATTAYQREVEITVNNGDNIYFGVCKFDATRSGEDESTGGTTTTYCYITYTSDGTTYYLNHNARFVAVDGEPTSEYQWLLQRYNNTDYYYVYYMNGTSQTWLVANYNNNSASTSTSTSNRLYYYNGRIVDDRNNNYNTYYLKGTTSSTTAPSVTSGTSGAATARTETVTSGGTSYYHDTDWVGADQFQITYMGTDPVMFDEDEESLDYLKDNGSDKTYTNQTVRLHREFVKDQWNTFVFPLDLSADQVRNGFGDETRLAEVVDLGLYTRRADCIDFCIVPLPVEGKAVTGGKLYLIKPQNDPQTTSDGKTYYNLGRQSFSTAEFEGIEKVHYGVAEGDDILYRDENRNGVTTFACYYRTSGYDQISGNTVTNPSAIENGVYVPKHSYVIGQNADKTQAALYWIKNNMKVKGFRGWLVDGDQTGSANTAKFYLGGIFEDSSEVSGIGIQTMEGYAAKMISNGVFDLSGRKVANSAEQMEALPKGMYIVNGKKYIVK